MLFPPFFSQKRYCLIVYQEVIPTFLNLNFERKNERQYLKKKRSVRVHFQIFAVKVQSSKIERRSRAPLTFSVQRTSLAKCTFVENGNPLHSSIQFRS